MTKKKDLLFSVTKKDFKWNYFSGSGGGGQHKNRHKNCVRLHHPDSGARSVCQDYKEKRQNEKVAFRRIIKTKEFQDWLIVESSRVTGQLEEIEKRVERELDKVKLEIKIDDRWTQVSEEELKDETD